MILIRHKDTDNIKIKEGCSSCFVKWFKLQRLLVKVGRPTFCKSPRFFSKEKKASALKTVMMRLVREYYDFRDTLNRSLLSGIFLQFKEQIHQKKVIIRRPGHV